MRLTRNHLLTVLACALVAGGAIAGPPTRFGPVFNNTGRRVARVVR